MLMCALAGGGCHTVSSSCAAPYDTSALARLVSCSAGLAEGLIAAGPVAVFASACSESRSSALTEGRVGWANST